MIRIEDIFNELINKITAPKTVITQVNNGDGTFTLYLSDILNLYPNLEIYAGGIKYRILLTDKINKSIIIKASSFTETQIKLAIWFRFGNLTELDNILKNRSKTEKYKNENYPFFWLMTPYERNQVSIEIQDVCDYSCNFNTAIIIQSTNEKIAAQRLNEKFKNELDYLYYILINELNKRKISDYFLIKNKIIPTSIDRYFYGSDDKKQNVFSDSYTDAIELGFKNITVYKQTCN